jgi:N-acylneuraminate cytidylyltransferase
MRHIAIIPARGGSKRLANKNILDFMGKPMIAWTIEAAQEARVFDRILVSTDSAEIAAIAEDFGVEVPFLRSQAFDDYVPVSEATCTALEQCSEILGEQFDLVTQLMANTPLRTADDISNAIQHFRDRKAPSQISCFALGWINPLWSVTLDEEGIPTQLFPDAQGKRSQDLPQIYCPTGAVWIAKTKALLASRTFYCPGHLFYPIPWQSAVDIDEEEDLTMAKVVFNMRQAQV